MMKSLGGTKEHPILFTTEMVRAILDGKKTQTRRVIKPKQYPIMLPDKPFPGLLEMFTELAVKECPYGQVGDRLWVRETWASSHEGNTCQFKADGKGIMPPYTKWRPSIFMPRWASRINLEITGVRVERVQDISEADAVAEGIQIIPGTHQRIDWEHLKLIGEPEPNTARYHYGALWDNINGKKYPWASNPWVWVVEFKRLP